MTRPPGGFTLADWRGCKYLTVEERARFRHVQGRPFRPHSGTVSTEHNVVYVNQSTMPSSSPLPVPAGFATTLPALVSAAGAHAERRFVGFFAAQLRNAHTRAAYARATTRFLDWCAGAGAPGLDAIEAVHVAAWVELRTCEASAPTVKQELAALRRLFDWLVIGQVLPANPATAVRGPAHSVSVGKTPVLSAEQARHLLRSLPDTTLAGLRDRALIATMLYTFARISAAFAMCIASTTACTFACARRAARRTACPATTPSRPGSRPT